MAKASRERTLKILAAIPAAIKAEIRITIEAQAAQVVAWQKRAVPKRSGALERSIRYVMGSFSLASSGNLASAKVGRGRRGRSGGGWRKGDPDLTATIIAGDARAWYARQVEFGTKPHTIRPKKRRGSLAINGNLLAPGQSVEHPGAPAQPFFYGPFRASRKRIRRAVSRAGAKAVKAAARK